MEATTATTSRPCLSPASTIALSTLIAGTLDIADALIFSDLRGVAPLIVFKYIAAALIGSLALRGGPAVVVLGLAIHYAITAFWATLFVLASRVVPVLRTRAIAAGLLYGFLIYGVMNFLVLPHTRLGFHFRYSFPIVANGVTALLLFRWPSHRSHR